MTIALGCVYFLVMLIFGIAFLVEWIRNFRQIRKYLKYGLAVGFALFGLNVAAIVTAPSIWSHSLGLVFVLVADVFIFVRAVGFTMLGMYYCALLGRPSFLSAMRSLAVADMPEADAPLQSPEAILPMVERDVEEAPVGPWAESTPESERQPVEDHALAPPVPKWDARGCVLHVTLVVVVSTLYSIVLFKLTSPQMSEIAKKALGVSGDTLSSTDTMTPQALLVLLTFAFGEEIFFRLGIQSFLAQRLGWRGNRYWLAIVVTAGLWTLGHAGTLEPGWVKFAQIFPLGVLLGWLFRKHGVESAICAHGLFNCLLAFPGLNLIG